MPVPGAGRAAEFTGPRSRETASVVNRGATRPPERSLLPTKSMSTGGSSFSTRSCEAPWLTYSGVNSTRRGSSMPRSVRSAGSLTSRPVSTGRYPVACSVPPTVMP
ncbi:hypothetical protein STANM309S_00593 [Streptomyces tanashiensis]